MNAGAQPNSVPALVGNASGYSSGSITFRFNGNNIGYYSYDGNGATDMLLSSSTMNDNAWHHIAVVRITATWYMYVDGILEDTWTGTNPATDFSFGNTLYIGQNGWDGANGQYKGYIDELRLSNTARYTANFTAPTTAFTSDANTMLLIHSNTTMGSTTFTDSSSGAHTITANGDVVNVAPKIGTGIGFCKQSPSSAFSVPDDPELNIGTGDFTMEGYLAFRELDEGNSTQKFITKWSETGNKRSWQFRYENTGTQLAWINSSNGSGQQDEFTFDWTPTPWTWYFITVCRSGTDLRVFVDGTQVGSTETDDTDYFTTDGAVGLGDVIDNASPQGTQALNGYMDEWRIVRKALRTSNFTAPTTAFKDDIDTVLLMHMDGGGGINPATNLPTLPGQGTYAWDASTNAIFYDSAGLPTNKSIMEWDGSGDYLSVPASSDFDFGSSNWTAESWVNLDTISSQQGILTMGVEADRGWRFFYFHNSSGWQSYRDVTSTTNDYGINEGSVNTAVGEWTHVAVVRNGTTVTLYVNGTSVGTPITSVSGDFDTDTDSSQLTIGAQYNNAGTREEYFDGTMDQIRISNTARYTSTFTPSTTPFTTDANTLLLIQSNDFSEGGLGADHSGNYNYFTPNNLTASDMMEDSPMNNFATWSPISSNNPLVLSEGNLKCAPTENSGLNGTFGMSSGKWYWEAYIDTTNAYNGYYGVTSQSMTKDAGSSPNFEQPNTHSTVGGGSYAHDYTQTGADSVSPYFANAADFVIGFSLDLDNGTFKCYENNVLANTDSTIPTDGTTFFAWCGNTNSGGPAFHNSYWNFGADSSFAGNKTAQGNQDENDKGDFYYAVPAGYLALCTDNLADPLIALPEENFKTIKYTGTDGSRDHTGVGFSPAWVWIKNYTGAVAYSHQWYDTVRGVGKMLRSDTSAAEITDNSEGYLDSFDSDGFSTIVGSSDNSWTNDAAHNYVAWNFKIPTAFSGATAGSRYIKNLLRSKKSRGWYVYC